jgi:glycosyltransferase involved in cell wall biosynthesis
MNELQRECELVVHGGAPAHPAPRERDLEEELRAGSKGRAIRYQGRYAPEALPSLLDGALALVVPSLVRESFGRTANEALLCGVPVIVPDEGGLAEQVEPGVNGLLFEAGNARSLAQAMKRMVREGEAMSSRDWKTGDASWPEAPHLDGEIQRLVDLYGACL